MVRSNPREWSIDIRAARHVCSKRGMFATFELVLDKDSLFMENSATIGNKGSRKCDLENDLWERVDTKECPLCTRNPKEPCV